MKKYLKPEILEEEIEIVDVVASSLTTEEYSPLIGDKNDPDSEGFGGNN